MVFIARRYASAVYAVAVCPSAGIVGFRLRPGRPQPIGGLA